MADEESEDQRVGSVLADRYELKRVLGKGVTGVVYAAHDRKTKEVCAVKVFHAGTERAGQLLVEAKRAAEIAHGAVVNVLGSGTVGETVYLVLELLDGETLGDVVARGELSQDEVVDISIQVLEGLAATHARQIVHRDVKPETIFLTKAGGKWKAKLTGFGTLGKVPEKAEGPLSAVACMSPEHARGERVDRRSDVWSCGATMFMALTGERLFEAETRAELLEKIRKEQPPSLGDKLGTLPYWLVRMVDGALNRDRTKRWPSASQMAIGLRNRGAAPLDLEWEGHEDLTLQTVSMSDDKAPAKGPATKGDDRGPSIVISAGDEPEPDDDEEPAKKPAGKDDRVAADDTDDDEADSDDDFGLGADEHTPVIEDEPRGGPWILVALIGVLAAAAWWFFGR